MRVNIFMSLRSCCSYGISATEFAPNWSYRDHIIILESGASGHFTQPAGARGTVLGLVFRISGLLYAAENLTITIYLPWGRW